MLEEQEHLTTTFMSFEAKHYRSLLREMWLQLQIAEGSSAVGPFL